MKILLVTGSFPPMFCGVGDYSARLASALRSAGADVQVLTTRNQQGVLQEDSLWVHRTMPYWTPHEFPELETVLVAYQPDVVHLQYPTQGYDNGIDLARLMLRARCSQRFAMVSTWHEYPPQSITRAKICQIVLALISRAIIVVRPEYRPHVRGLLAAALGRVPVHFVPNASVIPVAKLTEIERNALRHQWTSPDRKIVAFFGFPYPHKGVEQLFEIANPEKHHLLLIGNLTTTDPYHVQLRRLAESDRWRGHVTITGFLDQSIAANFLAASDAVVFPFLNGGGHWNSSLHAAMAQGTFAIATSESRAGYDSEENTYYAKPRNIVQMATALDQYAGMRNQSATQVDPWVEIAKSHLKIYRSCIKNS
jgi:glycosyltransferase involved in cell wall biosynthesis